jgi:hypothetical protein
MARGLIFHAKGYTGSITVTDGASSVVVTPTNSSSAFEVMKTVAANCEAEFGGTWTTTLNDSFFLKIESSGAGTWSMTLGGNTKDKMGMGSASYSGVSTVTATQVPQGAFFPYADGAGLLFALDARVPTAKGKQTFDSAVFYNTPATNQKRPICRFSCLRSKTLDFVAASQFMGTPAKVQIIDDADNSSYFVGNIRTRETAAIDGWSEIEMELAK